MEANRAKVQFTILYGLSRSDREYPLYKAEIDLEALKTAGSMPSAVSTITQTSAQDNQSAQRNLATLRTLQFSNSPNTRLMRAWYSASTANQTALQEWMNNDKVDPLLQSIPPEQLIDGTSPEMESDRGRAIRYFDIH